MLEKEIENDKKERIRKNSKLSSISGGNNNHTLVNSNQMNRKRHNIKDDSDDDL